MAFASITGTVDYVKNGGKGFTVIEAWKTSSGEDAKRRWAVWFDEPTSLTVGDTVSLNGVLGGKVGEVWTDKQGAERPGGVEWSLNKATHAKARQEQAPAATVWPDEQPF